MKTSTTAPAGRGANAGPLGPVWEGCFFLSPRRVRVNVLAVLNRLQCASALFLLLTASSASATTAGELVATVMDVSADYSESFRQEDLVLVNERARRAVELAQGYPGGKKYVSRLERIAQDIASGKDRKEVARTCGELAQELIAAAGIRVAPPEFPDLTRGAVVYAESCAACHGLDGHAREGRALGLDPLPPSFIDPSVMNGLSPFRVYSTVRYGVLGTAMPAYDVMSDPDRWAVAFYVMALRQPDCPDPEKLERLSRLGGATDRELITRAGWHALKCLRRKGQYPRGHKMKPASGP